jgi:2-keto-4-pentenoate hydratase/2-oxohepta-3-ene-1,7-dioic acid hydratase in catechol pathway
MTLLPGDVIATGTPPGVGLGMKPPLYLKKAIPCIWVSPGWASVRD